MKAVARLFALYFSGSTSARAWTLIGVAVIVAGCAFNVWWGQVRGDAFILAYRYGWIPRWLFSLLTSSPLAGLVALVFGSALLPKIVGQLAVSRGTWLLPGARAKLIVSALATIVALASIVTLVFVVLLLNLGPERPRTLSSNDVAELVELLSTIFALAFVVYTVLHVGLWLIGRFRGALGPLTGVLLFVGMLAFTMEVVSRLSQTALVWVAPVVSLGLWTVIALVIAMAPRLREVALRTVLPFRQRLGGHGASAAYARGHELDLALGTANPWAFSAGLVVPFAAALWLFDDPTIWSFYLALFAAILGGLAGFAATRTHGLWLRTAWDRRALFARVERAYWRHSAYGLAALSVCHVVLGGYTGLSPAAIALGLLTLALGTIACVYLGLTMTRGVGWRAAVTTVGTMTLLMTTASRAADPAASAFTVAALEMALLGLAVVFRRVAASRWTSLDWSLCRADTEARPAAV